MRWVVTTEWEDGQDCKGMMSTEELKTYLDRESFCLKHNCPLPIRLVIERAEDSHGV